MPKFQVCRVRKCTAQQDNRWVSWRGKVKVRRCLGGTGTCWVTGKGLISSDGLVFSKYLHAILSAQLLPDLSRWLCVLQDVGISFKSFPTLSREVVHKQMSTWLWLNSILFNVKIFNFVLKGAAHAEEPGNGWQATGTWWCLVRGTCYEHASESGLHGNVTSLEAISLGWEEKAKK